jgi:hypothetical protein
MWQINTIWFDIAIVASLVAVGSILFGHFEEGIPKGRRVFKFVRVLVLTGVLAGVAGRVWLYGLLTVLLGGVAVVHLWWLPKHGINGWTGEPKAKYYALRGWSYPCAGSQTHPPQTPPIVRSVTPISR